MIEYGVIYNDYKRNTSKYIFCAFAKNDELFISDALNNRVIKINMDTKETSEIIISNWFPRWIQPINKNKLVFVDSRKKTIGILYNDKITKEVLVPMEKPMFITLTNKQTYLVGGIGNNPLIEYDFNFNIIGKYLNQTFNIQSAEYINDQLLICDSKKHQVLICDKKGNVFWSYGKTYCPGEFAGELSTPKYACFYNDLFYIADGKNNRIICLNRKKEIKFIYNCDEYNQSLWWPCCLQLKGTNIFITDSANCRVIQLSLSSFKSKQFGYPRIKKFNLNNPRGIEIYNNSYFIADTYNHRILKFSSKLEPTLFYGENRGNENGNLFWPRAIRIKNNNYYIADSRNSRIVILDKDKRIISNLYGYTYKDKFNYFMDPHDIDVYGNKILVTDSAQNKIIEIDHFGKCSWIFGKNGELNDPHNARKTIDGNFLISDTRNNRVIKVSYNSKIIYSISKTSHSNLKLPRWSEEIDKNILITDSGNNRILLVSTNGNVIKQYGTSKDTSGYEIRTPRCARKCKNNIIISDTYNNRIIISNY